MKKPIKTERITFRVPENIVRDLETVAHGRRMSEVVREALVQHIKANTPMVNVKSKEVQG